MEKSETADPGGVTLFAKEYITERELYNQVIKALDENDILPESISFKRMSLEQIYLGVTSGSLSLEGGK